MNSELIVNAHSRFVADTSYLMSEPGRYILEHEVAPCLRKLSKKLSIPQSVMDELNKHANNGRADEKQELAAQALALVGRLEEGETLEILVSTEDTASATYADPIILADYLLRGRNIDSVYFTQDRGLAKQLLDMVHNETTKTIFRTTILNAKDRDEACFLRDWSTLELEPSSTMNHTAYEPSRSRQNTGREQPFGNTATKPLNLSGSLNLPSLLNRFFGEANLGRGKATRLGIFMKVRSINCISADFVIDGEKMAAYEKEQDEKNIYLSIDDPYFFLKEITMETAEGIREPFHSLSVQNSTLELISSLTAQNKEFEIYILKFPPGTNLSYSIVAAREMGTNELVTIDPDVGLMNHSVMGLAAKIPLIIGAVFFFDNIQSNGPLIFNILAVVFSVGLWLWAEDLFNWSTKVKRYLQDVRSGIS